MGPMKTDQAAERMATGRCTRCGGAARHAGIYVPSDQAAYDAPEGKLRAFVYGLCDGCACDMKNSLPVIEAMIESTFQRDLVTH